MFCAVLILPQAGPAAAAASRVTDATGVAPVTVAPDDVNDTIDAGFTTPDPVVLGGALTMATTPALQTIAPYTPMAAFTLTVTNPGDAPVESVVVTDSICDSAPIHTGGDANADDRLDTDETWTYTCSVTRPATGWDARWTTTAAVAGTSAGNDLSDDDTAEVVVANLAIAKNVRPSGDAGAFQPAITVLSGTDVEWQILVTNTGTPTLQNVSLTDTHCVAFNGPVVGMTATYLSGDLSGDELATMDAGESWEFTCTTTALDTATTNEISISADPVDGVDPVTGSASASATPTQPADASSATPNGDPIDGSDSVQDDDAGTAFDVPVDATEPADLEPIEVLAGTTTDPNDNVTPPATSDPADLVITEALVSTLKSGTDLGSGDVADNVINDGQLPFTGATTTLILILSLTLLSIGGAWLVSSRRRETLNL